MSPSSSRILHHVEPWTIWRWRWNVPSTCCKPLTQQCSVTSQKAVILNYTTVRTSKHTVLQILHILWH